MRHAVIVVGTVVATVVVLAPVNAIAAPSSAEQLTPFMHEAHYGFSGVVTKIRSGMLCVTTENSLRPRVISPATTDRASLDDAKVGESVHLLVDSGNVLMDPSRTDRFFPHH